MVSVPPPAPHTPQEHPYPITQDSMNCTRKNTSVQPLYSIACKETRGGGMVIHCKASPNPSFHTTAAESSPRGISCTSIAPMHGVSARPSTAPLEKGVRGVTGAERSRRHLPGRCWDHFATRAALSTQPLPQKSRPSCAAAVYSCTPGPLATRSRRDLG